MSNKIFIKIVILDKCRDNHYMNIMYQHLDKTFVLYVLEKLDISAYQLSKMTGISNDTFSRVKAFNAHLTWNTIIKIMNATDTQFMSHEHLLYSHDFYKDNPDLFKENQ